MAVYKLIYRFDFEPNFEIIDSAGKILSLLQQQGKENEKYWPQLGEGIEKRSVTGKNISDIGEWWYAIAIEPAAIIGEFEHVKGNELVGLENSLIFNRLSKATTALRKEFGLNKFHRAGIRLIIFNPLDHESEDVHKGFNKIFNSFSGQLSEALGRFEDSGIYINGLHDDGINYNLHFGPYLDDFKKRITKLTNASSNNTYINTHEKTLKMSYDFDFYEYNKYLSETTSLKKWAIPIMQKATDAISFIESVVNKNIEET